MPNKQGGVIKGEGGKYQKINKRPESKKKNFWQIGIHNGKNILLVSMNFAREVNRVAFIIFY